MSDTIEARMDKLVQSAFLSSFSDEERTTLKLFIEGYAEDLGVSVQIIEAITRELFSKPNADANLPGEMYNQAMTDLVGRTMFGGFGEFDLERVVDAAASLEFVVRYARKVDALVIPPIVIPAQKTVRKALLIFNQRKLRA